MSLGSIPNISARQLAAVLAVAENRSFIAASAQLQMSQPALTRTIKRVEDVLGVLLFERTTRVVQLTDAGHEFVPVAQRIANDLRIATRNMQDLANQRRGQVLVSSITSVANGVLPGVIAEYRQRQPGIEIHIRDGVQDDVLEEVKRGGVDFGINYLRDLPEGIASTRLWQGTFDLVARKDSPIVKAEPRLIELEGLKDLPLVSLPHDSQTRRVLDAAAATRGVALVHAVVVSQVTTLFNLVRAGVGAALVPSASISGDLGQDLVRLELCDPQITLDIGVIRLSERVLSPAAAGLLQAIEFHCQQN